MFRSITGKVSCLAASSRTRLFCHPSKAVILQQVPTQPRELVSKSKPSIRIAKFHSTPLVSLGARRRRRGSKVLRESEDDDEPFENPLKHTPVTDPTKFQRAAKELLEKVEKAVSPMKEKNDIFVVTRGLSELGGDMLKIDLAPAEGSYRIEIVEEDHLFQYTSPISGKVLYVLSATTGEWVGIEDGHLFEGLLVRDLLRQCRGLPKF
jgi:hypothetical protein